MQKQRIGKRNIPESNEAVPARQKATKLDPIKFRVTYCVAKMLRWYLKGSKDCWECRGAVCSTNECKDENPWQWLWWRPTSRVPTEYTICPITDMASSQYANSYNSPHLTPPLLYFYNSYNSPLLSTHPYIYSSHNMIERLMKYLHKLKVPNSSVLLTILTWEQWSSGLQYSSYDTLFFVVQWNVWWCQYSGHIDCNCVFDANIKVFREVVKKKTDILRSGWP